MEQWKQIRGFPEYMVSDRGRVMSCERAYKYGKHDDMILKQFDRRGYCATTLFKNGKRYKFQVHRLVAEAFIPNPNEYPCVNHKDECRDNNCVDNLEWCTHKYNSNYGNCREKISERVSRKVGQYTPEGELIKIYDSMTKASQETKIHLSSISVCCKDPSRTSGGYKWRKIKNDT